MIPKVERPRHSIRGATSSSSTFSILHGWDAVVVVCARGLSPFHVFTVLAVVLGLLGAQKMTSEAEVVGFGVPSATSPASPPRGLRSSGDGGDRYCCSLLVPGSGVGRRDGGPLLLPPSSSSSELKVSWSFLVVRTITFRETATGTRRTSVGTGQSSCADRGGRVRSEKRSS